MTTNIHAVVDGLNKLIRLKLTGGNTHDIVPACELIEGLKADKVLADKAYDADRFIALAREQGSEVAAPPTATLKEKREIDHHTCKERRLVECFFAKIKAFRRVSTRYEKLAFIFRAVVLIAACLVWMR